MRMSRKKNVEKEMFQPTPTTECINSLTIDDIARQAVPSVIMYVRMIKSADILFVLLVLCVVRPS